MLAAVSDVSLVGGWLPLVVDLAALALIVVLVLKLLLGGRPGAVPTRRRRAALALAVAAAGGAAVGLGLSWLLSDQLDLFDVSLSPISRAWVAGAFAVVGLSLAGLVLGIRSRTGHASATGPKRGTPVVAAMTMVAALLAGAIGVNADFGQYTTIGSLGDASIARPFPASIRAAQEAGAPGAFTPSTAHAARPLWRDAVSLGAPRHGLVGAVTIPATISHFPARGAYVYLPPAALLPHPVALPVLIMLSGQPGSPSNVISSGQIAAVFDAFAASHGGLAPIVVAPDQLGAPNRNPMCVDGSLGASATYLTVDVPTWIRTHLTVETNPRAWAIGGFSQGGTCSIQLGSERPDLFSAIVDISGQSAPKNGGLTQTIAIGFGGDTAAYQAALPRSVLARQAPYRNMVAVFGVGQLDSRYAPVAAQMTAAAASAGIRATEAISPGTGHDWHTVQWVLVNALAPVYRQLGLEAGA